MGAGLTVSVVVEAGLDPGTRFDVDGQTRLDYLNNYTALLHGYADPAIVEAAVNQVRLGASFPAPTAPDSVLTR